jgi:hypothetical protein
MLTLFSVPKAFRGEFATIQRNAIQSWQQLQPACEVILMGDDPGVKEAAAELATQHVATLGRNEFGTPLLSDAFAHAQGIATYSLLCYVNTDIIFLNDLVAAVERVLQTHRSFLIVGQRWDLDVPVALDFNNGWESRIRREINEKARLEPPNGIDYFIFPRQQWRTIPPFAVGRPGWDNWMIYNARARNIPVIDATRSITAVHQNHSYCHIPGGHLGSQKRAEGRHNLTLAGGFGHAYTIRDASHKLTATGVHRRPLPYDIHRCASSFAVTHSWMKPLIGIKRAIVGRSQPAATEECKTTTSINTAAGQHNREPT